MRTDEQTLRVRLYSWASDSEPSGVVFDLRERVNGQLYAARIVVFADQFKLAGDAAADVLDAIVNKALPRELAQTIRRHSEQSGIIIDRQTRIAGRADAGPIGEQKPSAFYSGKHEDEGE